MNSAMIVQLIYRDFRAYRAYIVMLSLFILVMSMFVTFINTNTLGIFSSGIGNIIMIVLGVFAMEQSGNLVRMHTASLPVSRNEIVIARFGTSAIIVLGNTILHFIIFNVLTASIHQEPVYTSTGLFIFAMVYGIFQLSIYFLVFYRLSLIISVILFILPALLWTSISPGAGFLNDYIPGNNSYLLTFSLVTLGLLLISIYTTVIYYKKKDL